MRIRLNGGFGRIEESYLFSEVGKRIRTYRARHPGADVISLGIGDVTLPLPRCAADALVRAGREMGNRESFRGYAPEHGYEFLREAVAARYRSRGVSLQSGEIFISDGAKSDLGGLVELFGDNPVFVPDPGYPVYRDTNLMAGRRVLSLAGSVENGFLPQPDYSLRQPCVVYLCSPGNPTGAVYDRPALEKWVDYALDTGSLLLFDAAYEAFVGDNRPRSIFEIPAARACAIEIGSLSKTAGFTGLRCGWTVVPEALQSDGTALHALWARRQATKCNGVAYPVQRAAEAVLSPEGEAQCAQNIRYYLENARCLAALLDEKRIPYTGGDASPYLWMRCPGGMDSWAFFDWLLESAGVAGTPGEGFGQNGAHHFRLSAFGDAQKTAEAVDRMRTLL